MGRCDGVRQGARTGRCGVRRGAHGESWEVTGAAPRPPPLVSAQKIQRKTLFYTNQRCVICGEAGWVRWLLASKGTKSLVFTNRYKYEHKYLDKVFGSHPPCATPFDSTYLDLGLIFCFPRPLPFTPFFTPARCCPCSTGRYCPLLEKAVGHQWTMDSHRSCITLNFSCLLRTTQIGVPSFWGTRSSSQVWSRSSQVPQPLLCIQYSWGT